MKKILVVGLMYNNFDIFKKELLDFNLIYLKIIYRSVDKNGTVNKYFH